MDYTNDAWLVYPSGDVYGDGGYVGRDSYGRKIAGRVYVLQLYVFLCNGRRKYVYICNRLYIIRIDKYNLVFI